MSETLNFTRLADAPMLETVPDNATAYAEVDGKVYRVPGDSLGSGGGGIKTAIIQLNLLTEASEASETARTSNESYKFTGTCQNMTYDEAKAILLDGQPLAVMLMMDVGSLLNVGSEVPASWYADGCIFMKIGDNEVLGVQVTFLSQTILLGWSPDGSISTQS